MRIGIAVHAAAGIGGDLFDLDDRLAKPAQGRGLDRAADPLVERGDDGAGECRRRFHFDRPDRSRHHRAGGPSGTGSRRTAPAARRRAAAACAADRPARTTGRRAADPERSAVIRIWRTAREIDVILLGLRKSRRVERQRCAGLWRTRLRCGRLRCAILRRSCIAAAGCIAACRFAACFAAMAASHSTGPPASAAAPRRWELHSADAPARRCSQAARFAQRRHLERIIRPAHARPVDRGNAHPRRRLFHGAGIEAGDLRIVPPRLALGEQVMAAAGDSDQHDEDDGADEILTNSTRHQRRMRGIPLRTAQ